MLKTFQLMQKFPVFVRVLLGCQRFFYSLCPVLGFSMQRTRIFYIASQPEVVIECELQLCRADAPILTTTQTQPQAIVRCTEMSDSLLPAREEVRLHILRADVRISSSCLACPVAVIGGAVAANPLIPAFVVGVVIRDNLMFNATLTMFVQVIIMNPSATIRESNRVPVGIDALIFRHRCTAGKKSEHQKDRE